MMILILILILILIMIMIIIIIISSSISTITITMIIQGCKGMNTTGWMGPKKDSVQLTYQRLYSMVYGLW